MIFVEVLQHVAYVRRVFYSLGEPSGLSCLLEGLDMSSTNTIKNCSYCLGIRAEG